MIREGSYFFLVDTTFYGLNFYMVCLKRQIDPCSRLSLVDHLMKILGLIVDFLKRLYRSVRK
jgi:hypothetical protein